MILPRGEVMLILKRIDIATSPPSSVASLHGTPPITKAAPLINNNFFSSSAGMDYEVECVEIRVQEGEMDGIIPRSS